jgi:serine/threonine protein kinase
VIAKDFIKGMLVVDPKLRMSAREALDHPVRLFFLPFLPFTPSLLALSSYYTTRYHSLASLACLC